MRWILLLAACVGPGFTLMACSGDGVTPTCSEATLYSNRYTDADREAYKQSKMAQDPKNPNQPDLSALVDENCITAAGDPSLGTSGGTGNTSGGTGNTSGGTGGTGGTTGGTGGTN